MFISDGGKNLTRTEVELRVLHEKVKELPPEIDREMSGFPRIQWVFTAPDSPSQNGSVERYVGTVKRSMKSLSHKNPMRDLRDHEVEFLFCRVESVLNSHPLAASKGGQDDQNPLTPNHFNGCGTSPLVLNVPQELLSQGNEFTRKWFLIEEAMLLFWELWWAEYASVIRRLPKWTKGEVDLNPDDLVLVLENQTFRTRMKYPVARVLSVERDSQNRIQTVLLKFRQSETRRGIRELAPLPMHL